MRVVPRQVDVVLPLGTKSLSIPLRRGWRFGIVVWPTNGKWWVTGFYIGPFRRIGDVVWTSSRPSKPKGRS